MRRRDFLIAAGGAGVWPLGARAQPRIPRIGYLAPAPAKAEPLFYVFHKALLDLGYSEGKSVEFTVRFLNKPEESLTELASELIDLKLDVIVSGGPGVLALHDLTKTIPIVTVVGDDLVSFGLAESLDRPGGNVTGMTFFAWQLAVKHAEQLRQVKPTTKRVGLLVRRGAIANARYLPMLKPAVEALGLSLAHIEVSDPSECERAFSAGAGASVDGVVVADYPEFSYGPGPATVAAAAARRGLPTAGGPPFARAGGLIAYGVDFEALARRAAVFVDKILKGARPGDLPIEQASKFVTVVNLNTAKALGLDIPPPLLAAADEVIE